VPILHIVDAAAAELRKVAPEGARVGVMGTSATLEMRLYQDRLTALGWDVIVPSEAEMAELVMPAIRMVKANQLAQSFAPAAQVVTSLAARGAQAVILGCTELPLAVQAGPLSSLPVPIVDTIDALARASIAWARAEDASAKR
jgi:aspartate racemase